MEILSSCCGLFRISELTEITYQAFKCNYRMGLAPLCSLQFSSAAATQENKSEIWFLWKKRAPRERKLTEAQHKEGPISICIKVIWEFEFQLEVLELCIVEVLRCQIINQTVLFQNFRKLLLSKANKIMSCFHNVMFLRIKFWFRNYMIIRLIPWPLRASNMYE